MKRMLVLVAVLCAAASHAAAASCPFNVPVVTLPPHQVAGFSWGNAIQPMGDACVSHIAVENTNAAAWYVGGFNGIYMTKNSGVSWTKPVLGNVGAMLWVPSNQLIYVGVGNQLYLSRDHGTTWTIIKNFSQPVRSLLVAQSTLYVGLGWSDHVNPSGIFTSNLGGGFMTFHAFGAGQTGLIVWTISRDPIGGNLYAGTEIFDHPQPYHPPFFRSTNNAQNWQNIAGTLPWHVIDSAVRPNNGYVYALTEGAGLYGSSTQGNAWIPPDPSTPSLGVSLLMDPNVPTRLYAGRIKAGTQTGGIFRSINSGNTFSNVGLVGVTVSDIALNGTAMRIYAAAYASGIYSSPIP
jgi:hypothetical protein